MEVLLLEDVPTIGKKNDLLMVGDGYALNCLLPRRKAIVATPAVRKKYAEKIRERANQRESERMKQEGKAAALSGKKITLQKKVTKTGKLYAAITEPMIAEALKEQHSIDVSHEAVKITEPIKSTGTFEITLEMGSVVQPLIVEVKGME